MLTSRDYEIIEFVKEVKVASTSTISQLYFPSLRAAQIRLSVISSEGALKRSRSSVSNEFAYFSAKPKQFRHSLLVSDFYRELSKYAVVKNFHVEPVIGNIRPDAIFGYQIGDKKYLGLLEVEISNKGLDLYKYNKLYSGEGYKQFFPTMPIIFVVSNLKSIPATEYKVVSVNTVLSDLPIRLGIR